MGLCVPLTYLPVGSKSKSSLEESPTTGAVFLRSEWPSVRNDQIFEKVELNQKPRENIDNRNRQNKVIQLGF